MYHGREHTNMTEIYDEIKLERQYQKQRWGNVTDDTLNTPHMWVTYISAQSVRWMAGIFTYPTTSVDAFRAAMIKTAAVCVAAIESLDRQRMSKGKAFYESDDDIYD